VALVWLCSIVFRASLVFIFRACLGKISGAISLTIQNAISITREVGILNGFPAPRILRDELTGRSEKIFI
jgi:hypothetical protein